MDTDHETFKAIFGEKSSAEEYYKKIKATSADKFKPLDNFLKRNTEDTKDKNIELLAWLLDIKPRPYRPVDMYFVGRMSTKNVPLPTTQEQPEALLAAAEVVLAAPPVQSQGSTEAVAKENSKTPFRNLLTRKALFMALPICILMGIGLSLNANKKQCMYWNNDRYVPVACDQKVSDLDIIALVPEKLKKLKRITRPDTLTEYSVGKVWRGTINGNMEFFTDSGTHPTDNRKRLLPLTKYILEKYIQHKTSQDSSINNNKKGQPKVDL